MNIALPILLLVFGGLSFWLLTESKVRWHLKISCIVTFCVFTVIFWSTIHSPRIETRSVEDFMVTWIQMSRYEHIRRISQFCPFACLAPGQKV